MLTFRSTRCGWPHVFMLDHNAAREHSAALSTITCVDGDLQATCGMLLQVLETTSGSTAGSLLSTLDACATPAGRRKLKDWLCRPLGRVSDIRARQDAVHALMTDAADAASNARKLFCGKHLAHLPTVHHEGTPVSYTRWQGQIARALCGPCSTVARSS